MAGVMRRRPDGMMPNRMMADVMVRARLGDAGRNGQRYGARERQGDEFQESLPDQIGFESHSVTAGPKRPVTRA